MCLILHFILFDRYGDLYTEKNVAISGIHTHAGPGGYLQYVVYIVTSLGFVRQSFDVIVDGIVNSVVQAHENLRPGSIFVNKGKEKTRHSFSVLYPLAAYKKMQAHVDEFCILLKHVRKKLKNAGS